MKNVNHQRETVLLSESLRKIRSQLAVYRTYESKFKDYHIRINSHSVDVENKIENLLGKLKPISEKIANQYICYKKSCESLEQIKKYLDLEEIFNQGRRLILKEGLQSSNRDAFFQTTRQIKSAYEFLRTNAPSHPQYLDWKELLEDAFQILQRVFSIEFNDYYDYNERNLKDAIFKWTLDNIPPNFNDTSNIFVNYSSGKKITGLLELLYESEQIKDSIQAYIDSRLTAYNKTFSLFKEAEKVLSPNTQNTPPIHSQRKSKIPGLDGKLANALRKRKIPILSSMANSQSSASNLSVQQEAAQPALDEPKNFNNIMNIMAAFLIIYQYEVKSVNKFFPQLFVNDILSSIYKNCLKYIEAELDSYSGDVKRLASTYDLKNFIILTKNLLPSMMFIYQTQDIMYDFAKGPHFVMVKKEIATFTNTIEVSLNEFWENLPKALTECEKLVDVIETIEGVFEIIQMSKQTFILLSYYKKGFAYSSAKMSRSIKYSELDSSCYVPLQSFTSAYFTKLIGMVPKICEKMSYPFCLVISLNNYEFLLEIFKSNILRDLVTNEYLASSTNDLETLIKATIEEYLKPWRTILVELSQQKDILAPIVKDSMMYGKQLPKNKKENIKTLFKNFNSALEVIVKSHENMVLYQPKIGEYMIQQLKENILPVYKSIHDFFLEVPFSSENRKYIRITVEEFSKFIEGLF